MDAKARRIRNMIGQAGLGTAGIRGIAGNSIRRLSLLRRRQCLPMVINYRTRKQGGAVSGSPETTPPFVLRLGCGFALCAAASHHNGGGAGYKRSSANQAPQNQAGVHAGVSQRRTGVGQSGPASVCQTSGAC